jgi:hypothetical protein
MRHDRARFALTGLLALLAGGAVAQPASTLLHLRAEGYAFDSGADAPPAPAGAYLALACDGSSCRLMPVEARWTWEPIEAYGGATEGWLLRGSTPAGTLALLRGFDALHAGPVTTEYVNPRFPEVAAQDALDPPPQAWAAAGVQRQLRFALDDPTPDGCLSGGCFGRWTLEGDGAPVVVARADGDAIYGATGMLAPADALVWAGDLDGDGRLDLLLRPQPRPDYLELHLLLGRDRPAAGDWPAAARFSWWDPANAGC